MVNSSTFIGDTLFFIKNDLATNITDPIAATRPANSRWVMTSYPSRATVYPLITIKIPSSDFVRAGMQVTTMDATLEVEVRIWGRNTKERDQLFQDVVNRLSDIQFTVGGSVDNELHDFNILSAVEIDEEKIKSKVLTCQYKFFNL